MTGSQNRSLTAIGSRFTHWLSLEQKEGRPTCHGQNLRSTPGQSEPIAQYFFKNSTTVYCTLSVSHLFSIAVLFHYSKYHLLPGTQTRLHSYRDRYTQGRIVKQSYRNVVHGVSEKNPLMDRFYVESMRGRMLKNYASDKQVTAQTDEQKK